VEMKKVKFLILFLAAVGCASSLSCGNPAERQPQSFPVRAEADPEKQIRHLHEGLRLRSAGDFDKAIEEFKKSIEAGNDDKEMYRRIAEVYLTQKKYDAAVTYLKEILAENGDDAIAHWTLAKVMVYDLRKYEEGLKEAKISRELYSKERSYVFDKTIGEAYDGLEDYENAIKHYKVFLKGSSYIPDSNDYKETKKRVEQLEVITKDTE
jgi:tetratricopeptide (TPR) repeat protein